MQTKANLRKFSLSIIESYIRDTQNIPIRKMSPCMFQFLRACSRVFINSRIVCDELDARLAELRCHINTLPSMSYTLLNKIRKNKAPIYDYIKLFEKEWVNPENS